ncbi:GH92 family glycosyl hydrolase [candidate division KSB1 bacterium]|nr:GH92 family glycosyl hydrolase [candidate division KSB1 bacterium]RQW07979.1 MAG: glycoside hydrolase family 92 protein [candidate division KSB1 bacterium]
MHMKQLIAPCMILLCLCCSEKATFAPRDPLDHVDLFIGSAKNSGATPGAATPWGMVTMTPQFAPEGGSTLGAESKRYKEGRDYLYGFSPTAPPDIGSPTASIFIMPVFGQRRWRAEERKDRYSLESASPGYYKVRLDRDRIFADFTATPRSGLCRFRYQNGWAHIVLGLSCGLDQKCDGLVRITAPNEVVGYVEQNALGQHRKLYFVAQFDRTAMGGGLYQGDELLPDTISAVEGSEIGAVLSFRTLDGNSIQVKIGVSYVSIDNARLNLQTEQPSFSFALIRQNARAMWTKELGKISIAGGSADHATMFYTALYRSLLLPHIFQDVNGEYPLLNGDDGVGRVTGMDRYSLFSLQETYRTLHPLLATLYPARQLDMIHSLLGMAIESGELPVRELHGQACPDAAGSPAAIVIADTYMRGLHNFDVDRAYEAMRQHLTPKESEKNPRHAALMQYDELGYIPHEMEQQLAAHPGAGEQSGSVSTTLEYALADWCTAQLAKALGKSEDADFFGKRSQNYAHLFDGTSGSFRARSIDGKWLEPFDPFAGPARSGRSAGNDRQSNSAWQTAFFVPHDVPGLIDLYGADQFVTRLQASFENGYFAIGNAQERAYPFLFNWLAGEEWRTQKTVRQIVGGFGAGTDGLAKDAAGALSAWLVWAMLGLYPDCPASALYQISTPFFDHIELYLDSACYPGKSFVIETKSLSDENIYIKSIKLNGARLRSFTLQHDDLTRGGTLQMIASRKNESGTAKQEKR